MSQLGKPTFESGWTRRNTEVWIKSSFNQVELLWGASLHQFESLCMAENCTVGRSATDGTEKEYDFQMWILFCWWWWLDYLKLVGESRFVGIGLEIIIDCSGIIHIYLSYHEIPAEEYFPSCAPCWTRDENGIHELFFHVIAIWMAYTFFLHSAIKRTFHQCVSIRKVVFSINYVKWSVWGP